VETLRLSGAGPQIGIKLHATFVAAGLPAPSMRLESVIGGGGNISDQVHFKDGSRWHTRFPKWNVWVSQQQVK
jgi:hypothetical protein